MIAATEAIVAGFSWLAAKCAKEVYAQIIFSLYSTHGTKLTLQTVVGAFDSIVGGRNQYRSDTLQQPAD